MVTPKQKVSGLDKPYLRGDFLKFATNFIITNWILVFVTHFILLNSVVLASRKPFGAVPGPKTGFMLNLI